MIHLGGNYILMPIAFLVFFICTQLMFENSNPDPEFVLTYGQAQHASLKSNECVDGDSLSQMLYSTFQIVSIFSYLVMFYYIVATVVVIQSACLIKAIVQRRISLMRRRDLETQMQNANQQPLTLEQFQEEIANAQEEEEEGNIFIEGMFGGLLTIPLPVPEIIQSLDKTKYKTKQADLKKKQKSKGLNESQNGIMRQCPICWSDFMRNDFVTTLHCDEKHIFHTECIE